VARIPDALFERALNAAVTRGLNESPRSRELLSALTGRRLGIEVSGTPWTATLVSTGTALKASLAASETGHDAKIIGAPLSLLALSGPDPQALIQRGDVRIEGDSELAQRYRELAVLLRPDLEPLLAEVLGRSGAHLLMRGLRGAAAWTRATAWTGAQNLGEYLAHEQRELVSRAEAEHFLRGVDELREQLDRLAARAAQLERQTRELAGGREPA
jgi:ubiquinone biosynthesis protein UbiJ